MLKLVVFLPHEYGGGAMDLAQARLVVTERGVNVELSCP